MFMAYFSYWFVVLYLETLQFFVILLVMTQERKGRQGRLNEKGTFFFYMEGTLGHSWKIFQNFTYNLFNYRQIKLILSICSSNAYFNHSIGQNWLCRALIIEKQSRSSGHSQTFGERLNQSNWFARTVRMQIRKN